MAKILEVIVTSEDEAREAEAGGADRLELVRALDAGGLTPDIHAIEQVLGAVRIPVRVMLRDEATLTSGGARSIENLRRRAVELAQFPVDGLVLGFAENGSVDLDATARVLEGAPHCKVTFHKAFDEAVQPLNAIAQLKTLPQIDRILTSGGSGSWEERTRRLGCWQEAAAPEIRILVGAGLCELALSRLRDEPRLTEVHVGRAARAPSAVNGKVCRERVAALKSALQ